MADSTSQSHCVGPRGWLVSAAKPVIKAIPPLFFWGIWFWAPPAMKTLTPWCLAVFGQMSCGKLSAALQCAVQRPGELHEHMGNRDGADGALCLAAENDNLAAAATVRMWHDACTGRYPTRGGELAGHFQTLTWGRCSGPFQRKIGVEGKSGQHPWRSQASIESCATVLSLIAVAAKFMLVWVADGSHCQGSGELNILTVESEQLQSQRKAWCHLMTEQLQQQAAWYQDFVLKKLRTRLSLCWRPFTQVRRHIFRSIGSLPMGKFISQQQMAMISRVSGFSWILATAVFRNDEYEMKLLYNYIIIIYHTIKIEKPKNVSQHLRIFPKWQMPGLSPRPCQRQVDKDVRASLPKSMKWCRYCGCGWCGVRGQFWTLGLDSENSETAGNRTHDSEAIQSERFPLLIFAFTSSRSQSCWSLQVCFQHVSSIILRWAMIRPHETASC